MLKINHLSKSFGTKKILDNVSLEVKQGEIAVLLGSSGVGKSTLLRVLNNLEAYDQGQIMLNGSPLDISSVASTHTVGMVFQQFNLFDHWTVIENITRPLELTAGFTRQDAVKRAESLLAQYRLLDKKDVYPARLSGGQKQRLALARTLALEPRVVCLDEPTSALDPRLTNEVAASIMQLAAHGYTVLVATHDTGLLAQLTCTIHLMNMGRIVESVSSSDYYASPSSYPHMQSFIEGTAI